MKVIGIVDNKTKEDNSYTLVKVALNYIAAFNYETEMICTEDFDFGKESRELDALKESLDKTDAVIFGTSITFTKGINGINVFLEWMNTLNINFSSKVAGSILLIEPEESADIVNEEILNNKVKEKGFNVISDVVFTKVSEENDIRNNTYALSKALKIGEDIQSHLKNSNM